MILYIPEHLQKLEILADLAKLLEEYNEQEKPGESEERDIDSFFDHHYYDYIIDPVQNFISLIIKDPELVNYYTNLLYAVKGTQKVLTLTKKFLFSDDPSLFSFSYDSPNLVIEIGAIETTDLDYYRESLENYFKYLLFFDEYKGVFSDVTLQINSSINSSISTTSIELLECLDTESLELRL